MMNDLISRQAAIDEIEERIRANGYSNTALVSELNRLEGYILRLPTAVKHGKWIKIKDNEFEDDGVQYFAGPAWYMCPICSRMVRVPTKYCSVCGMKSDGEEWAKDDH